jgi:anti-sigma factor RsiW
MTGHTTDCSDVRNLLGVYVVGAIEPAERATVDAHLPHCPECREELAGLAGLPALLGRVPLDDAERIALGDEVPDEPSAELLDSLLQRVSARRRARRWRMVTAAAAAAVIAVGGGIAGGTVISHLHGSGSGAPSASQESGMARGANPTTGVTAAVYYTSGASGTHMQVQVNGIPPGEHCIFWVNTRGGRNLEAGAWTTASGAEWFPAQTSINASQLKSFDVSVNGHRLVTVPVS